jgi:hypothetical protein
MLSLEPDGGTIIINGSTTNIAGNLTIGTNGSFTSALSSGESSNELFPPHELQLACPPSLRREALWLSRVTDGFSSSKPPAQPGRANIMASPGGLGKKHLQIKQVNDGIIYVQGEEGGTRISK